MSETQVRDIIYLDTETLGLHPDAPIWEFAAVRRNWYTAETFTSHFTIQHNPEPWIEELPDQFLDDYGNRYIHEESWCELAAAAQIQHITADTIIVGSNPGFDIERLAKLLDRQKLTPEWHYHPLDIASLALGYLAAQGRTPQQPWKSDQLSAKLGVNPADYPRHTAMGDVQWVMAQWDRMANHV